MGATTELAFDYVAGSSGMYQEYQLGYANYAGSKDSKCVSPLSQLSITLLRPKREISQLKIL